MLKNQQALTISILLLTPRIEYLIVPDNSNPRDATSNFFHIPSEFELPGFYCTSMSKHVCKINLWGSADVCQLFSKMANKCKLFQFPTQVTSTHTIFTHIAAGERTSKVIRIDLKKRPIPSI